MLRSAPAAAPAAANKPALAPIHLGRRAAVAALLALGAAQRPAPAVAEPAAAGSSSSGGSRELASAITITKADPSVQAYMASRDEAMRNRCPGGMFDCDGDRRDYAKKQWQEFLDGGGVPKRVRDGRKDGPRAF
ncbi:MAG: hypothetical protein J3K34DRAFT_462252 [Monoraphidium minutum]|nr:MAG: hypothetical protein J3K34DRAFT_462252 [Monoraphidium minutum]